MGLYRMGILERFREGKTRLGGPILTLLLAGWLNVLGQPCLMAAPLDDCDGATSHHQSIAPIDGNTYSSGLGHDVPATHLIDCDSMVDCIDWISSDVAATSADPEFKFLSATVSSTDAWTGKFEIYRAPVQLQAPPPKVPLFIENCAFLI